MPEATDNDNSKAKQLAFYQLFPVIRTIAEYADAKSLMSLLRTNSLIREYVLLSLFKTDDLNNIRISRDLFPVVFFLLRTGEIEYEKSKPICFSLPMTFEKFPNSWEQWLTFLFGVMPTKNGVSELFFKCDILINLPTLLNHLFPSEKNYPTQFIPFLDSVPKHIASEILDDINRYQPNDANESFFTRLENIRQLDFNASFTYRNLKFRPTRSFLFPYPGENSDSLLTFSLLITTICWIVTAVIDHVFRFNCLSKKFHGDCSLTGFLFAVDVFFTMTSFVAFSGLFFIRNGLGILFNRAELSEELKKMRGDARKTELFKKWLQFNIEKNSTVIEVSENNSDRLFQLPHQMSPSAETDQARTSGLVQN